MKLIAQIIPKNLFVSTGKFFVRNQRIQIYMAKKKSKNRNTFKTFIVNLL